MSSDAPQYSPPQAPDPNMVAAAQGRQERQTARANNLYLNPNVSSPFGKVRYDTNEDTVDGETIKRPEQTIELGPLEQEAYERGHAHRKQLGQVGEGIGQHLQRGVNEYGELPRVSPNFEGVDRVPNQNAYDADRKRYEDAYFNRVNDLLAPQYERSQNRLESKLAALGHPQGNQAYSNAMNEFTNQRDFNQRQLANEAILNGGQEQRNMFGLGQSLRGEQVNEALRPYQQNQMERQGRMGENQFNIGALQQLLGGQNVQMPQLQQFNASAMRAPDIQGIYGNNYQQQSHNYNTGFQNEMANHGAHLQGMYGLAGHGIGAAGRWAGAGFPGWK